MNAEVFEKMLDEKTRICDSVVESFLPEKGGYAGAVIEAMHYSVEAGGKRLRPMILMEVAESYGVEKRRYVPFMAALEMIHTYSLVHDDLPAMDNDVLRRGMDTTWVRFGEGFAVLAGDALLNHAYETALWAVEESTDFEEQKAAVKAMRILMRNAGVSGMVGGQSADLTAERSDEELVDREYLSYIHAHKTGSMIESAFMIGGALAGASDEEMAALQRAAQAMGLGFQIRDDILDVIGDEKTLGKSIGKDAAEGKKTYVTLYSMEEAVEKVKECTAEALENLQKIPGISVFLEALVESMTDRIL